MVSHKCGFEGEGLLTNTLGSQTLEQKCEIKKKTKTALC